MWKRNISSTVSSEWLKQTEIDIKEGRTTLSSACKHVQVQKYDGSMEEVSVSRNTLRTIFHDHDIFIFNQHREGFKKQISQEIEDIIVEKARHLNCGITKIWEALYWDHKSNKEIPYITRPAVQKICQEKLNYPKKGKKVEKTYRTRYVVEKVNAIWHGDIHNIHIPILGEVKYLFAVIDDRSRMIMRVSLLDHKTPDGVIRCLQEAITTWGTSPFVYWSDNGGENISNDTRHFLEQNGIVAVRTQPGNPQQNGKIERWWPGVDKEIQGVQSWYEAFYQICMYVEKYNYEIPHHGLEKIDNMHVPPYAIYSNQFLQKTTLDECNIFIDGKPVPFREFIHKNELTNN